MEGVTSRIAWVLGFLLCWQGAAWSMASPAFPSPVEVFQALIRLQQADILGPALLASLSRVLSGYFMGVVAGISLGALAATRAGAGLMTVANLLRPIPPIAWVPLAILWLGLGDKSARFIVFIGAFFPIFVSVAWSLARCPAPYLELARTLGASPWLTLRRVRLPAAAPGILTGLRTGLGLAWTSVIAAELVGAQEGLGYRIQAHRLLLETDAVIACMLCIGVLGTLLDGLAALAGRRGLMAP